MALTIGKVAKVAKVHVEPVPVRACDRGAVDSAMAFC